MHALNDDAQARTAIRLFLVLLTVLVASAYVPVVLAGSLGALGGLALPLLMWTPGVAAMLTSAICYRSLASCGLSIRPRAWPWLVAAWVVPALYTAVVYLPLEAMNIVGLGERNLTTDFLVVGLGQSFLFATGEEIGWRGFFTPLMIRHLGFIRGNVTVGIVWALFHVPAILFAGYAQSSHSLFGMVAFSLTVVFMSVFLGASRMLSGSVWPAAVYHASHNNLFLHAFDPVVKTSPSAEWLIGEQGILLTVAVAVLAVAATALYRRSLKTTGP